MYTLDAVKKHITDLLNGETEKVEIKPEDLVYPPQPEYGDLSLPCFKLASSFEMSPGEVAEVLVGRLKDDNIISSASTIGPYLNITLHQEYLAEHILGEVAEKGTDYGKNEGGEGRTVIAEYSNINTHKEYHIGHLRNICYGEAVVRLLDANDYHAVPVSYVNDFGIHVAKTLWNYREFLKENYGGEDALENLPPEEKGKILGKIYADAARKEKESPTAKQMIGGVMKKIETGEGEEYGLWERTREWNIKQFDKIYRELGVRFDHIYYEHQFIEQGKKRVRELVEKGVLVESEGAIIADLEEYGLGTLVFIRSDGTAMYPVADIPLAEEKIARYDPEISLYVVDIRQGLYFQQLFKVLELMGYTQNFVHLAFDFVKLPEGMMSSRSGNIITYKELKGKIREKILNETEERHPDWSREQTAKVADTLTQATIKFEMLKVEAKNIITFDVAKALSFEGYTAAYIQYTYARINSVLNKKAESESENTEDLDPARLTEEKEKRLLLKIAKFPETVKKAGDTYDPSEVAKYLFDLTSAFNDYYHSISILKNEKEVKKARSRLTAAAGKIIENGLNFLGIETTDKM